MTNKNKKHLIGLPSATVLVVVISLVGTLGFLLWSNYLRHEYVTEKEYERTYSLTGQTYTVKGRVTRKETSCGLEKLEANGSITRGAYICDGGNSLTIEGVNISTGGGALEAPRPEYITDIDDIHAGDEVEARYAKDEDGRASTNCSSCYVKGISEE